MCWLVILTVPQEVVAAVNTCMAEFGAVRYSRAVRSTVWTQYREGGAALAALTAATITALGVEWKVLTVN